MGSDLRLMLLLVLCSVFITCVIGPSGNFPTNDDWLYAAAVKSLVVSGRFSIPGSNAFDFVPIYSGAFLCGFVGFSFEVLRWLTVVFHCAGILGLYSVLREMTIKPWTAAFLTSVYAFNPFMINLSLSFMSDVPALSFSNWAFFFSVRAVKNRELPSFILADIIWTLAMSVRQSSIIFLPATLIMGILLLKGRRQKLVLLASVLIPIVVYYLLQCWLINASTADKTTYFQFVNLLTASVLSFCNLPILDVLAKGACYIGLFLFPITVPLLMVLIRGGSFLSAAVIFLIAVIFCIPLINAQAHGSFMPYSLNLFMPPILGSYCIVGSVGVWKEQHLQTFTYFCDLAVFALVSCLLGGAWSFLRSVGRIGDRIQEKRSRGDSNRVKFLEEVLDKESLRLTIYLILSAIFATGGL
ncbi:MAG: glycosyltransferase family 39 protein, partial [Candidatus Obscuribacterales bacterium]|nr:glycosyltransferase family 39 protein [Candidatus Obscuribacterales bacterium]